MMKKAFIFSFLALFVAMTGLSTHADAKRFGGGKSFGKSFSKQKSYSSPSAKKSLTGQKAAAGAQTGSRAGGMMGILGGLAMGGLLGAMFFGGGFEGINFMDILIIAGIGFAIFWFMRRAASNRRPEYAHAGHNSPLGGQQHEMPSNNDAFTSTETTGSVLKPQIDTDFFLGAARDIFMRMQADWDAKNIDDIRSFCTPDIADIVIADIESSAGIVNKTEVGMLNADIADTWIESDLEWVAIHFTAMLKEDTLDAAGNVIESNNSETNEFWIFQHNPNNDDPTWYLAGIQQQ